MTFEHLFFVVNIKDLIFPYIRCDRTGFATIRKSELISAGFNPKFFTHYWKNAKGEVYLFVYEYGFLSKTTHGKEKYILVTWQEYMN